MIVVKCCNGHFFDSDTYDVCPECGESEFSRVGGSAKEKPASKPSFKKAEEPVKEKKLKSISLFNKKGKETILPVEEEKKSPIPVFEESDSETVLIHTDGVEEEETEQTVLIHPLVPEDIQKPAEAPEAIEVPVETIHREPVQAAPDNDRTVMFYDAEVEPVVGWLVCVKGVNYGCGFEITSGKNSIGRNEFNDIALVGDKSVSKEKQATIIFDPVNQKFMLQSGEGSSLTYVNEELLMSFVELKAYDKIMFGKTMLIFMPLSGEKFNWSDYPEE